LTADKAKEALNYFVTNSKADNWENAAKAASGFASAVLGASPNDPYGIVVIARQMVPLVQKATLAIIDNVAVEDDYYGCNEYSIKFTPVENEDAYTVTMFSPQRTDGDNKFVNSNCGDFNATWVREYSKHDEEHYHVASATKLSAKGVIRIVVSNIANSWFLLWSRKRFSILIKDFINTVILQ